jgi:hypothetical protein
MQTKAIAIYNATNKELLVVASEAQVQNYWRTIDGSDNVFTLTNFELVDSVELAGYEHDDFVSSGWEQLQ